jgi:ABC-type glycerol-3-phosphate transport system substrate-binding protein
VQWAVDLAKFSPPASATGQGFERFGYENNDIAIQIDRTGGSIMGVYYRTGDDSMINRFATTMHLGTNGGNWTPCDGLGINANLKGANADTAWEILKYMTGPEVTKWRFDNWGPAAMPYKNSARDIYDAKDIYLNINARIVAVSTHPGYEVNPFYGSSIQPELASMLSRSVAGRAVNVQAELDALQAKAVAWSATR